MLRKKYRCAKCGRLKDMVRFPLLNIARWDREGVLFCHACRRKNRGNNIIVEMEWDKESKKGVGIEYEEWELAHSRGVNSSPEVRGRKKEPKKELNHK